MSKRILNLFEGFASVKLAELIKNKKTYVVKKLRDFVINNNPDYVDIIKKLKTYDYTKFNYFQNPYMITITPDVDYMLLYKKLCDISISTDGVNTQIYKPNLKFNVEITYNINMIDFNQGVPTILSGTSLGYNLYKLVIQHNDFISSNNISSLDAYNLWYNLLQDNDLYGATSNSLSILINKKISDNRLKEIMDLFKHDLEFDDDLILKITQIYGSLDFYKKR